MKTQKTVAELMRDIADDGCYIYTNDDGSGCGGPGDLSPDEISDMLADGRAEEYCIVDTPTDAETDLLHISMAAHNFDAKTYPTQWIIAMRQDDDGYQHYLYLWEIY